MTALHTYSYIVVDTQRGCHTLKLKLYDKFWYLTKSLEQSCMKTIMPQTRDSPSPFAAMNSLFIELFHQPTLMTNFLYSLTICMLHYYPRHVSSINMPIFRRKNCIHTASGIVVLCKRLYSTPVKSGLGTATKVVVRRQVVKYTSPKRNDAEIPPLIRRWSH